MTDPWRPRRSPECQLENLDGEVLLYHAGLTRAVRLNDTAALVWNLCDGRRSVEDITDLLRQAFPDEADEIAGDVAAVLTRLTEERAIEPS